MSLFVCCILHFGSFITINFISISMEAKSTDRKTFQLTDNGQLLASLLYEDLLFAKAEIKIANENSYLIAPVGFWGSSINVIKNGNEVAKLVMTWGGHINILFTDGREFVLKLNAFFYGKYIVEDKNGEMIFQLSPKFNWRAFHYNYEIAYGVSNNESDDILLLLLGIYSANYFIACMSGASAGMI